MSDSDLYPWKCVHCQRINKKTATKCAVCKAYWTTGTRRRTQPRPTYQDTSWQEWEQPWEEEDSLWEPPKSRSTSQATHRSTSQNTDSGSKGPRRRKGKGKGKSKVNEQNPEGKGQTGGGVRASPFAPLAKEMPTWLSLESSAVNFASAPSSSSALQNQRDQEAVALLKQAYPDPSKMPPESKEFIEHVEKENAKAVTKNLHWTTRAIGRAQKTLSEALEAKKVHRTRWAAHVTEAIKIWEGQLKDYRQEQNAFQEVINKSRSDI
eukprot:s3048_g10.t1